MKQKRPYIYNSKSRQVKAEIISLRKNSFIHRSLEKGIVSREALEAARRAVKKVLKKKPFLTRCAAFQVTTSKPSEVRMGKGKGKISGAICKVEPGTVFFEIRNVAEKLSMAALLRASVKLPVRTQICTEG